MRVLFDTNVWIAGLIARGACADLIDHCLGAHQLVVSDWVLEEVKEKLTAKFQYGPSRVKEVEAWMLEICDFFELQGTLPDVSRDADDNHVLLSAKQAQVACLVSGDKDLLVLEKFEEIPIVSPSGFWAFEDQRNNIS